MMPLYDDNSDRKRPPVVTYVLIALNLFGFFVLQGAGNNDKFTYAWSTVPAEITTGKDIVTEGRQVKDPVSGQTFAAPGLEPTPVSVYLTLLTSMFMHGGLAHLFGNMLFLFTFGDNVEDKMGPWKYTAFYLLSGFAASMAHVLAATVAGSNTLIPCLGASGAISGVMAAYVLTDPHRRVTVLVLRMITEVPAYVMIGVWFLFQLINGLGVFGSGSQEGGVAYGAHIGGFVAGLALGAVMMPTRELRRRPV